MKLDSIESVIEDFRAGKIVVIIDDEDRENEGDLTIAAEHATPEAIGFMIEHGKGLICLSLTGERLTELGIPAQVNQNTALLGTNFTVSIDHRSVATRGVTASGRAETIVATTRDETKAGDFVMPGFVFPLGAVSGGVLKRPGQTEGSVDLARLAGLKPAAVICEVMDADGSMLNGARLEEYCKQFQLKITSVRDIARYRLQKETHLRRVAECRISDFSALGIGSHIQIPKEYRNEPLRVLVYVDDADDKEHLAIVRGDPRNGCYVRIHSECLTGDVFESKRCDCGSQFDKALATIFQAGQGVLVYLHQEGRGIGLANKLRAYELQDQGRDTVEANIELGFEADSRDYNAGAQILADLGLSEVRLMTNNPDKVKSLETFGIKVATRVALVPDIDEHNASYIETKRKRLGHLIPLEG